MYWLFMEHPLCEGLCFVSWRFIEDEDKMIPGLQELLILKGRNKIDRHVILKVCADCTRPHKYLSEIHTEIPKDKYSTIQGRVSNLSWYINGDKTLATLDVEYVKARLDLIRINYINCCFHMNVRLNHVIGNWGFPGSATSRIYAWAAYLIVRFPIFFPLKAMEMAALHYRASNRFNCPRRNVKSRSIARHMWLGFWTAGSGWRTLSHSQPPIPTRNSSQCWSHDWGAADALTFSGGQKLLLGALPSWEFLGLQEEQHPRLYNKKQPQLCIPWEHRVCIAHACNHSPPLPSGWTPNHRLEGGFMMPLCLPTPIYENHTLFKISLFITRSSV